MGTAGACSCPSSLGSHGLDDLGADLSPRHCGDEDAGLGEAINFRKTNYRPLNASTVATRFAGCEEAPNRAYVAINVRSACVNHHVTLRGELYSTVRLIHSLAHTRHRDRTGRTRVGAGSLAPAPTRFATLLRLGGGLYRQPG